MDLEALLANLDAFKAKLDTLETDLIAKDAELEKVTQNRDSIFNEKRALEGRNLDLDALDRRIRESAMPSHMTHGELHVTREQARNGQAYQEAKAKAEKLGVPLRVVGDGSPAQPGRRSSLVKLVSDPDSGVCYVNAELIARYGQARCRQMAAERGAPTMRAFRSASDLPKAMQQAHAQALADRAPGTLLASE